VLLLALIASALAQDPMVVAGHSELYDVLLAVLTLVMGAGGTLGWQRVRRGPDSTPALPPAPDVARQVGELHAELLRRDTLTDLRPWDSRQAVQQLHADNARIIAAIDSLTAAVRENTAATQKE